MKFIKSTLLLGIVLAAPAGLTFWVLVRVIRFFDDIFSPLGVGQFPGMGLVVAFGALFFIGLLGKTFAGRVLKNFVDWSLEQLPFVRGLYRLFNQIGDAFFSGSSKSSFKKVVQVPFGAPGAVSIAFWVKEMDDGKVLVFVPAAPNPTTGFILKFPKEDVEEVSMTVEDAFKVILSCGALLPSKT
ncbi:MAG: DUF502 domain-containing protein [Bdellovibrionota bacterium]